MNGRRGHGGWSIPGGKLHSLGISPSLEVKGSVSFVKMKSLPNELLLGHCRSGYEGPRGMGEAGRG